MVANDTLLFTSNSAHIRCGKRSRVLNTNSRTPADFVKLEGLLAIAVFKSLKSCEAHVFIPIKIFPELLSVLVLRILLFVWYLECEQIWTGFDA